MHGLVTASATQDSVAASHTAIVIERAAKANPPMQLPPPDVLRDQLLESLIVKEIQLQRAERIGLQVSDAMLNQAIEQLAMQQGIRFEDMPALLAQDGVSYSQFRREFRDEVTLEQLVVAEGRFLTAVGHGRTRSFPRGGAAAPAAGGAVVPGRARWARASTPASWCGPRPQSLRGR